jgi:hypothetical protein
MVQKTPISKITRAKWTGGAASCKHEVLNSNPSPTKKKKGINDKYMK